MTARPFALKPEPAEAPTPLEKLVEALEANGSTARGGGNWTCPVPEHEDAKQSLRVGAGRDGNAVLWCHADCADLTRIHFIPLKRDAAGNVVPLTFPEGADALRRAIKDVDAALVIVDPVMAFLGEDINSHNDASVRKALGPLKEVAEATGAAIVFVRHLNKSGEGSALYRGGGSIAFIGAARTGLLVAKHPDDENLRVLAVMKQNLSDYSETPSWSYAVKTAPVEIDGQPYQHPYVEWGNAMNVTADQLLRKPDARKNAPVRDACCEEMRELFSERAVWPVKEMQAALKDADFTPSTIKDSAAHLKLDRAKVVDPETKQVSHWTWALPTPGGPA